MLAQTLFSPRRRETSDIGGEFKERIHHIDRLLAWAGGSSMHLCSILDREVLCKPQGQHDDSKRRIRSSPCRKYAAPCYVQVVHAVYSAIGVYNAVDGVGRHSCRSHLVTVPRNLNLAGFIDNETFQLKTRQIQARHFLRDLHG